MRIRLAALLFHSIALPVGSARENDEFAIDLPGLILLAGVLA